MIASLQTNSRLRALDGCLSGQEVWILADGLSARTFDMCKLDLSRTLCVNHSYLLVQGKPAFLFAGDHAFMSERTDKTPLPDCAQTVLVSPEVPVRDAPNVIRYEKRPFGLGQSFLDGLYGSKSIGIIAMGAAILMGASLINLVGFDYRVYSPEEAKEFFGVEHEVHASGELAKHRNRPGHVKMKSRDGKEVTIYEDRLPFFAPFVNHKHLFLNHNKHSALRMFPFAQGES